MVCLFLHAFECACIVNGLPSPLRVLNSTSSSFHYYYCFFPPSPLCHYYLSLFFCGFSLLALRLLPPLLFFFFLMRIDSKKDSPFTRCTFFFLVSFTFLFFFYCFVFLGTFFPPSFLPSSVIVVVEIAPHTVGVRRQPSFLFLPCLEQEEVSLHVHPFFRCCCFALSLSLTHALCILGQAAKTAVSGLRRTGKTNEGEDAFMRYAVRPKKKKETDEVRRYEKQKLF